MLARRGDVVAGGILLDDLDVGDQSGPREDALEQIVAEERVLRNAPRERRLEDVDVVDALAGVGALAEEILVDVGDGERVRIHARRAREDALEERSLAAHRQRRRDARLQHGVALDHAAGAEIEPRTVERVRHLADQPLAAPRGSRVSASSVIT